MSLKQLLIDYRIPFSEQGKNIGNGWIGLKCPFCDDHSNHLGLNLQYDFFHAGGVVGILPLKLFQN